MRKVFVTLVAVALMLTAVVPAFAQENPDIVDIAVADGRFTTLVAAVQAAGLVDTLKSEGPFTVFAPTDDAFSAALSALNIEAADLLADTETLTDILLYHVVSGEAYAADVVGLESVTTVQGSDISISVTDDGVFLNDSVQVIITDIQASNGVIHVIDFVLLPPADDMGMMEEGPGNIAEVAAEAGSFTTLLAAVEAAGLVDALTGEGPLTVFAPTDDAFAAAFAALGIEPADLLADTETLTDILLYHVVAGEAYAADVVTLDSATTLNGLDVSISVSDEGVFLNDSTQVIATDVMASNGVIHVIDSVLLPPFSVTNDGTNNLNFRAGPGLDEAIIGLFPSGARAEAMARNEAGDWVQIQYDGQMGWVYAPLTSASGDLMSLEIARGNIVEVAAEAGSFTTLLAAAQAAGLAETLSNDGPFTVFAPTDEAFAAALAALEVEAADLLANTELLTDILLYHVVAGEAYAADVVGLESVTTVQGSDISISVTDDGVFLNDSVQVIATDVMASNGVIHVIDFVLLPPAGM